MAEQTLNTNSPAPKPLNLDAGAADLLSEACNEIEQLTRVLGTMKDDDDSLLIRRSVAVRVHDLNRVVQCALNRDESFDMKEAGETVYGPGWWGVAA